MTHMYRTKLRIIMDIECEAESLGEAQRIIDGVIEAGRNEIVVFEGPMDDCKDELFGTAERIERDEIVKVP